MARMPSTPVAQVDPVDPVTLASLVTRAAALVQDGRRAILGIAGAPGAGKTTLARALVAALQPDPQAGSGGESVVHLPMDGFHLADVQLDALGLRSRKGAPETFDAHGYLAALERILADDGHTVFAPGFERDLEQPIAAAIAVEPSHRLVVTEGNYLLLDADPWARVRERLDEVWFVDLDDPERQRRLVSRHVAFGKPRDAAQSWALGPDQANADRVLRTRRRADLVVTLSSPGSAPPG